MIAFLSDDKIDFRISGELIFFANVELFIDFIVFDITDKEQLLKNVRKGLVQPLSNKYPLLNFDKLVVKNPIIRTDESFIKSWVDKGYFFAVYNGYPDLLQQILSLCEKYKLGSPALEDKNLLPICIDNDIPFLSPDRAERTLCSSFSKLEVTTNTLYFSSELQPIRHFFNVDNLILFGKSSQIDSPENNKYFCELMIKNDVKVQLPIHYFNSFKSVFLFIEE